VACEYNEARETEQLVDAE